MSSSTCNSSDVNELVSMSSEQENHPKNYIVVAKEVTDNPTITPHKRYNNYKGEEVKIEHRRTITPSLLTAENKEYIIMELSESSNEQFFHRKSYRSHYDGPWAPHRRLKPERLYQSPYNRSANVRKCCRDPREQDLCNWWDLGINALGDD